MAALTGDDIATAGPTGKTWRLPLAATVLGTVLSFALAGYLPIAGNNIYHLPILFGSYDLPQFQDDPFVQSLRNFSSGFWLIFAGSARYVEPKLLLGVWLGLTHFLFLGSSAHLARSLGYRDPKLLSAFVIILALASLSIGEAGGGGALMIENFTHSELANATLLLALSFAVSKRYGLCVLMGCATFFLNAFMAVWAAFPLLALLVYHLRSGQMSLQAALRSAAPGFVGLILLVPVLGSILANKEGLLATSFSYPDFLWSFYPAHFFINSIEPKILVEMAGLLLVLALTVRRHGQGSGALMALALGAVTVLALGILAPLVTDSRTILNLHLIRGFVVPHMLAVISLSLLALSLCWAPREKADLPVGLMVIGLLLLPRPFWLLAIPLLLLHRFADRLPASRPGYAGLLRKAAWLFLALCVAVLPVRIYRKLEYTGARAAATAQWEEIGNWARRNTAPGSIFLVAPDEAGESALGFSYTSERRIWTSNKYGAAVMWSPSYIDEWHNRYKPVSGLADVAAMVTYARAQGMAYVAAPCASGLEALHQDGRLCVYAGAGSPQ